MTLSGPNGLAVVGYLSAREGTVFPESQTMSATTTTWISKLPGRCGGRACVRDTRITVWGLVAHRRSGMSDRAILDAVQGLHAADLEAAWEYAAEHTDEIDRDIRQNEEGYAGVEE